MKFVLKTLATALVIGLIVPCTSAAQGGGASSTGTIQGRVADSSGAVLPGVTVTATSPSMIGIADAGDQRERLVSLSRPCRRASTS